MQTARDYGIPQPIIDRAEQLGHIFDTVCRTPGHARTVSRPAADTWQREESMQARRL